MVTEEERQLVLARLDSMPANMKLSLGGSQSISKAQLINHVRNGDPLGDKYVEIQLTYLRAIAKQYV